MLHPETKRIAEELTGYVPFTEEECQEQFPAPVNYDPLLYNQEDENTHPITGCVFKDPSGKLQCYWKPEAVEDSLEGWYPVPSNGEIEEWALDSTCLTPADDEVEPDHPDSWLTILALI